MIHLEQQCAAPADRGHMQFSFRYQRSRKDAVPLRGGAVAPNHWLWQRAVVRDQRIFAPMTRLTEDGGGNMRVTTLFLVSPRIGAEDAARGGI